MDLVVGAVPGSGFVMLRPPWRAGQGPRLLRRRPPRSRRPAGYEAPVGSAAWWGGHRGDGRWRRRRRRVRVALAASVPAPGMGRGRQSGGSGGAGSGGRNGVRKGYGLRRARNAARPVLSSTAYAGLPVRSTPDRTWRRFQAVPSPRRTSPPRRVGRPSTSGACSAPAVPPLALATAAALSYVPGQPEVVGVRCELGHFNHPRVSNCLRCGRPVPRARLRSTVPALQLECSWLTTARSGRSGGGASSAPSPARRPEVQSGASDAIVMKAGASHAMAPVQAEVQIRDWSTYLVDRGAEGGSWVQGPAAQDWEQLGRNEQRELANGSHLSCGGRVLTYLSAWPL